jgi:hypothetical protein
LQAKESTESFGTGLQWAGTGATAAGSAMSFLAPFLVETGVTLSTLAPWIIAVVGALALLGIAF